MGGGGAPVASQEELASTSIVPQIRRNAADSLIQRAPQTRKSNSQTSDSDLACQDSEIARGTCSRRQRQDAPPLTVTAPYALAFSRESASPGNALGRPIVRLSMIRSPLAWISTEHNAPNDMERSSESAESLALSERYLHWCADRHFWQSHVLDPRLGTIERRSTRSPRRTRATRISCATISGPQSSDPGSI
jgi:hypothetical protein